jgi:KDO2-lipid IV(A) lauroyltransferase
MSSPKFQHGGARAALFFLWLLHWLPLPLLALMGRALGAFLYRVAGSRRKVALRNLELCFPEKSQAEREAIAKEHFGWLARSLLERGVLSYSSESRLRRLTRFKGSVKLAEQGKQDGRPVMWLTPHFVGLEWVGPLLMTEQSCPGISIYQRQSNPVFDAALRRMRQRFGTTELISRHDGVRQVVRRVRQGWLFMNLPDMDFGRKDSEFIPFFGVPACTLLAPSRMAASLKMQVQPIIVTMLPGGQGYEIEACEPLPDYPSEDAVADATRFHAWLEDRIRANPAQYLWVHKRFKTRPEGEPALYGRR